MREKTGIKGPQAYQLNKVFKWKSLFKSKLQEDHGTEILKLLKFGEMCYSEFFYFGFAQL